MGRTVSPEDLQPAEAFPAGEYLADELAARGLTVDEFARILGRPAQAVSEIVNGRKEITPTTAEEIAAATGTSAQTWLRLQDTYRLWVLAQDGATRASLDAVSRRARLAEMVPVAELRRRGEIPDSRDHDVVERAICDLLEIADPSETPHVAISARRAERDAQLSPAQLAWARCAMRASSKARARAFDPDGLVDLARQLTQLVILPAAVAALPDRFAKVGVRLIHVPPFKGSKLDGAAFRDPRGPVIALSARIPRLDAILFTLLHECAHVSLGHVEDGLAIDEDLGGATLSKKDRQADAVAGAWAIPAPLQTPTRVSRDWVLAEAERLGVHPAIVVGRLHHDGTLPWSHLNGLIPNVRAHVESWHTEDT